MNSIIFYSWQSDLPNSTNRGFIQSALETAARKIRDDNTVEVTPVVDRDTQNVPGSPDIAATIFEKIDDCTLFVCDISIINSDQNARLTPNPNVLLELGYAVKHLGWNRIIMLCNTAFSPVEALPFDLRMKKVLVYELYSDDEAKSIKRKELEGKLKNALQGIFSFIKSSEAINAIFGHTDNSTAILSREDTNLFKFACELTLHDGDSMVSVSAFEDRAKDLNLSEEDLIATIEILEEQDLIKVSWTHGGGLPSFEVTTRGFEHYAKHYVNDFGNILISTLIAIEKNDLRTKAQIAELLKKPVMFAEYVIDILAEKNLITISNTLFSHGVIEQTTTKGKRLITQIQ